LTPVSLINLFGLRDVRLLLVIEVLMGPRLRSAGLIAVTALAVTSLVGCGNNKPAPAAGTVFARASGGGSMGGGREVKFSLDGGGGISSQQDRATVNFTEGKVVVEKARVLLNDKEVAQVPENTKVVAIDYTAGTLTVTADSTKVYEAKLRE
jgi:hypothetical protein